MKLYQYCNIYSKNRSDVYSERFLFHYNICCAIFQSSASDFSALHKISNAQTYLKAIITPPYADIGSRALTPAWKAEVKFDRYIPITVFTNAGCCGIIEEQANNATLYYKWGDSMFRNKVAVVTGGANGIGKCIAEEFRKNGAAVCVIDKAEGDHFVGDISDKKVLEKFAEQVIDKHGRIDFLVNNALPLMKGIDECSYEEFQYALSVGVTAPFYLSKLFAQHFDNGGSIINISSSRDRMSQPQTESYTAAKGGIAALTHALAVSLAGKVRVNSISPGWIDTSCKVYEGPDAYQQPCGRVGDPLDIANMVMFLCSDKAGFITGENICIDGGMTKLMIYHGDNGWELK